ncbi:MAG TPA: flagellar hook-length control protein FliK [Burkholderiaceae bacterium]
MSPTLTIPSLAPPSRASEAAGNAAADGDGGAAFADALQRAQGEHKPARHQEPRAATPKPADAPARTARPAATPGQPPEAAALPAGDAACGDATGSATDSEPVAADAKPQSGAMPDGATTVPQPPMIVIEPPIATRPAIETHFGERARAADTDDAVPTIDDRAVLTHPSARKGTAHDLRAAPAMPGHATPANEPAGSRDGAPAWSFHTTNEQAAIDAAAATTPGLRAPSFERPAAEPSATPLAATPFARDVAAAAPGADAKLPQATLHAAIDDADFGAALGTQVSLWVRDGVQEARLQLHPAELGPVTVQIALEGQAAHVDFIAAVAATRESIEQSLPALAAALRESGFTLTGGGVTSQGGQGAAGEGRRERSPAGQGNRSRNDGGSDAAHVASAPRRWNRSLLDVYA